MKKEVKNIIIISIDDLRSDCIAANPYKELLLQYELKNKLQTPILDWFIKNGTFFSQCISAAPYTTTSHASILTGQWPKNHAIEHYFRNKLAMPTILEILKKRGFSTMIQTDFPSLLGHPLGFTKGVDEFIKFDEGKSFDWIKKNKNKSKACFFHFANVHSPYGFDFFEKEPIELLKKVMMLTRKYKLVPDSRITNPKQKVRMEAMGKAGFKQKDILRLNYDKIIEKMHADGKYSEIMDLYIEGINYFEKKRFSKFMKNLKEIGLFDNSIFVIVGDHGEKWGEKMQGHYGGSCLDDMLSDEVIKVPLIFFGKNVPKNKIINTSVRTIDIVPTIFKLLEQKETNVDGGDLFDVKNKLKDRDTYSQSWNMKIAFFAFIKKAFAQKKLPVPDFEAFLVMDAIRSNGWKLVQEYFENGKIKKTRLFDVRKGEKELDINKHKLLIERLRIRLRLMKKRNLAGSGDKKSLLPSKKQQKVAEELRLMGYNV